jgi:hypothetical protein
MFNFLNDRPDLFSADAGGHESCLQFGPLSRIMTNSCHAVLLRIIPRFAERTDLQLIEIASGDAPAEPAGPAMPDAIGDELGKASPPPSSKRDREFFGWYWTLMSAA